MRDFANSEFRVRASKVDSSSIMCLPGGSLPPPGTVLCDPIAKVPRIVSSECGADENSFTSVDPPNLRSTTSFGCFEISGPAPRPTYPIVDPLADLDRKVNHERWLPPMVGAIARES